LRGVVCSIATMIEFESHGIGNRLLENQYSDTLFNYRADHSRIPPSIVAEIKLYLGHYPDFRDQILANIKSANWTIEELKKLVE
jgi:hypothetical protein